MLPQSVSPSEPHALRWCTHKRPKALNHPLGEVTVENLVYDSPGLKEAFWDGTDRNGLKVAPGIYYQQLIVNGERVGVKKLVVTN